MGSKAGAGVYQTIIALMPPHDTYVELFAGSGVVLQRKAPSRSSIVVDADARALARIPHDSAPQLTKFCGDAFKLLDGFDYAGSGRTLIYADPPYLHSTRTSKHRYKFELSDEDHFALLQRLMLCPANVILSGYPSEMYDSMLQGWRTHEFQTMTRGGVRTEKLWFNFTPSAVHHAQYAGRNFTDRQRIKRKAARWAENFAQLPPGERAAILAAIIDRAEMGASIRPASSSPSTIDAGAYSCDRLSRPIPFPLPDSGATKPGPGEAGTSGEAR